jgi:hypothetical protein
MSEELRRWKKRTQKLQETGLSGKVLSVYTLIVCIGFRLREIIDRENTGLLIPYLKLQSSQIS